MKKFSMDVMMLYITDAFIVDWEFWVTEELRYTLKLV
jgi:hypothetical protein